MDYRRFFDSKTFRGFLAGIGFFIVLLVAFRAGMSVGFHKADFSYRFSDNYHLNFAGPEQGFRGGLEGKEFIDAHGTIGQIIKIDEGALVIKGKDGMEKIISVDGRTQIVRFREAVKPADLGLNDLIIVIGEPNNAGQIEAKFIRIMPVPPEIGRAGKPEPASSTPKNN